MKTMKLSHLYRISGTGLLAVSLAIIPFTISAQAQVNAEPEIEIIETEDNGFDWGWLGLFGLLGLAGLAGLGGKKNQGNYEEINTEPFPEAPTRRNDSQDR